MDSTNKSLKNSIQTCYTMRDLTKEKDIAQYYYEILFVSPTPIGSSRTKVTKEKNDGDFGDNEVESCGTSDVLDLEGNVSTEKSDRA